MFRGVTLKFLWQPSLTLLFLGILALIVFSAILAQSPDTLRAKVVGTIFWLLLFAMFAQSAADLWTEDMVDGSLDQAYTTFSSYIPLLARCFLSQILGFFLPLSGIFVGLWMVGKAGQIPWLILVGLILPVTAIRLMASALSLATRRGFGAGSLFFLSLSGIFFCLSVANRADLIWALGLIFSPFCLALLPFTLSLGHQSR